MTKSGNNSNLQHSKKDLDDIKDKESQRIQKQYNLETTWSFNEVSIFKINNLSGYNDVFIYEGRCDKYTPLLKNPTWLDLWIAVDKITKSEDRCSGGLFIENFELIGDCLLDCSTGT